MQVHERWLRKAESDLKLARKGALGDEDTLDSTIFHTQQCAEKSLKAYLAFKEQPLRKIHDLEWLVKQCGKFDSDFMELFDMAVLLNPYCFEFRYPTDYELDEGRFKSD